ncbi:MAG: isoprenylcysteine carboxylmethyltransferase family protein [Bacteroidales bacterium]
MNYLILISGTILIVIFSWFFSIKEKRYHGVARFFVFESIFVLFLLNYRVWFQNSFSLHQIISWILLFGSIYPALAGFLLLKRMGKSEQSFENTTVLVKSGIYRYIRHPLYCSLILLGTGIMFKNPGNLQLVTGAINLVAAYLTARIEEKEMLARFGDDYRQYMGETKMFIPKLL